MNWWWLVMLLATVFQLGAMVGGVAQALNMAFPNGAAWFAGLVGGANSWLGAGLLERPEHPWAVLTALAAVGLLLLGGYQSVERITTVLVVSVTAVTVACVLALPGTGYPLRAQDFVDGLAISLPAAAMATAFSVFGITGVGASELFYYPYWCPGKRIRAIRRDAFGRPGLGAPRERLDARAAPGCLGEHDRVHVATVAFYILGATVLHRQGLTPKGFETIRVCPRCMSPASAVDENRVPCRGVGGTVQDAVCFVGGEQPLAGGFSGPHADRAAGRCGPATAVGAAPVHLFSARCALPVFCVSGTDVDGRHRRLCAGDDAAAHQRCGSVPAISADGSATDAHRTIRCVAVDGVRADFAGGLQSGVGRRVGHSRELDGTGGEGVIDSLDVCGSTVLLPRNGRCPCSRHPTGFCCAVFAMELRDGAETCVDRFGGCKWQAKNGRFRGQTALFPGFRPVCGAQPDVGFRGDLARGASAESTF